MQRVVCAKCSAGLKAPPQLAAKAVKCPKCGGLVNVPALPETDAEALYRLADAPAAGARQETTNTASTLQPRPRPAKAAGPPKPLPPAEVEQRVGAILAGFKGEFKRPRRGVAYRLHELAVLLVVLLLPVLYAGMIAGVGWLLYAHAVNDVWMMGGHGRAVVLGFILYAAVLVGLGSVLFAMVVPVFSMGRGEEGPRRSLTRTGEPVLFAVVDHLCDAVRAPRPSRIDVMCEPNASARFRRGVWSFFGSDLVLTIGLPFAAGLSAKQLIGVLAHEFGHFTQGLSTRLTYTIGLILNWFARAANASAGIGSRIDVEAPGGTEGCAVAFGAWIVRTCLWVGRQSLAACFHLGRLAALSLLRRAEFDADAYETGLVGSKTFEETCRMLPLLSEGFGAALQTAVSKAPTFQGVPEDVPAFAGTLAREASGMMLLAGAVARTRKTSVFDTHPADKDRIAAARAAATPGVFNSDLPAAALFTNFPALCRNATFDFYRQVFSRRIKPEYLVPNAGLLELGRRFAGCVAAPAKTF